MRTFHAISDPTRAKILQIIASNGIIAAGDICANFSISNAAISQHLKILKEANLVNMEIDAKKRLYSINPNGINEISDWINELKYKMESRIDRLEDFLNNGKDLNS